MSQTMPSPADTGTISAGAFKLPYVIEGAGHPAIVIGSARYYQRVEQFDRPVFLALGRYDFIVAPPSSWDDVKPKFKNLTIRIYERSGHTPQFEEPELFDRELVKWMQETSC